MAAGLDSSSAICSSHHSWHIGSDSGVESVPIWFPAGIWHQAGARLSGHQNPFCYTADLWHSIAELSQSLWFELLGHLAFPLLSGWCCLCQWWCHWDKSWPLHPQFQLPARSWRLIGDVWGGVPGALNPARLCWRHASTWATCACQLCLWGHVSLRDGICGPLTQGWCCVHFPQMWCFRHRLKGGHHPPWTVLMSLVSPHTHLVFALGKHCPGEVLR